MSTAPEVHYWASGMPRKEAQLYLLDLCGSESQEYTENKSEVTCERCLAALRADSGPASSPAVAGATGAPASTGPVIYPSDAAVAEQVRAAVLKEREEIIEYVQGMRSLASGELAGESVSGYRIALRHVIDEIRRRP